MSDVQWWQQRPPRATGLPRRGTDRLEDYTAWMLTSLGLFVLVLSVLAGLRTEADVAMQGRAAEHERARLNAVVLHEAAASDPETEAGSVDWVTVQYTDHAGQVHEADVQLIGRLLAGTAVQLWVDRAGRLAPRPLGPLDAVVSGAAVGVGVAAAGWLLLVVAWAAVRRVVDTRNAATWGA